ncbi:MAG: sensor histidine kinase [Synechococcaceae cyanobacterium SM2_3_2]|nr:sensor histidine kinase [Synechococcaceae cyanobacterium SM2_3_2]
MDWQFAFERSEMLRLLQGGLLQSVGHELKTPLNGQVGALEMILSGLCDSPEEEREYVTAARQAVDRSLAMLQDFSQIARYRLPIQDLQPQSTQILPLLQQVRQLTTLPAQDRGIRYLWPNLDGDPECLYKPIWADPDGLTQALWGLCHWSITCLRYGTIQIQILQQSQATHFHLDIKGSPLKSLNPEDLDEPSLRIPWQVAEKLITVMGGQQTLHHAAADQAQIQVVLPWGSL